MNASVTISCRSVQRYDTGTACLVTMMLCVTYRCESDVAHDLYRIEFTVMIQCLSQKIVEIFIQNLKFFNTTSFEIANNTLSISGIVWSKWKCSLFIVLYFRNWILQLQCKFI